MDIPMLVAEIREQLASLDVSAQIEVRVVQERRGRRAAGSGLDGVSPEDVVDLRLSEVRVTSLPLKLPLVVPEAQLAGFRDRLSTALNRSLASQPLWIARSTLLDVRVGRRLFRQELEVNCEYSVIGATVAKCPRHGWEARGARFHSVVVPELDAEFHMVDFLPIG